MRKTAFVLATSSVLAISLLAPAAAVASPQCCPPPPPPPPSSVKRNFEVHGPDTRTSAAGTVTFFNRSVKVVGQIDGLDENETGRHSCRYVSVEALGERRTSASACTQPGSINLILPADRPGGARSVLIKFWYDDGKHSYASGSRLIKR